MRNALWCVVFAMGCTLTPAGGDKCRSVDTQESCAAEEDPAQRAFDEHALPVLLAMCAACHDGASAPEIGFLAGQTPAEIRDTLLASGIVDVATPTMSRILTKGVHSGPYLSAQQVSEILLWLEAEQAP